MRKKFLILISFIILLLSSCSFSDSANNSYKSEIVNVYLEESEGFQILSQNPKTIIRGQDAIFDIKFMEGFEFDSSDDGFYSYEDSSFIVKDVQYSCNVSLKARTQGNYTINVVNDDNLGSYNISPNKKAFNKGDMVTIKITPKENKEFMCFSYNNPYRNYDYNKETGMAVSFEDEYTFKVEDSLTLYTNYLDDSLLKMEYFANGGETIDEKESLIVDFKISKPNINPNTLLGTYYFFRDGYSLDSYNTKSDGTGEKISIGSKVDISNAINNKITLYAQWKKWDESINFETIDIDSETTAITKYVGSNDKMDIVIPNIINGKKVTEIKKDAFKSLNFNHLNLNLDLKKMEENAINNCSNLESLTMYTNINDINEKSINSNTLKTIFINSTVYANSATINERDLSCQLDQIKSMKNQRVIFVGQSTIRYNHDFSLFKQKYPNKDFYVYGMQAGAQFALPLDILINFLNADDTIIVSILETTIRKRYIGSTTFVYLKYEFDLLRYINYQDYKEIFFPSYVKFVEEMSSGLFDKVFNSEKGVKIDDYGSKTWGPITEDVNNVDPTYVPNFEKYQKSEDISYLDDILNKSSIPNERRYLTWSTYNENSVVDEEIFNSFETFVKDNLTTFNYFDSILDNVYPGNYFRNKDSIHLSTIGGTARINRWLDQIPLD